MSTTADTKVLSRSFVFHRLENLLSDVSSVNSSEIQIPFTIDPTTTTNNEIINFDTSFAHLSYRQDLSNVEHVHFRCRPASSFNSSIHTSLCEAVLGIFPDTSSSTSSSTILPPVLVRGVVERRHRRIKVGDWLLAINETPINWININDILPKYHSSRKLRLTIRHPDNYNSTFSSSLQSPIMLPSIEEKKLSIPEQIDCIHAILYYEKRVNQGFKLLYQQPAQKDIFFAAGGVFPTLTQLMYDMNEHDSLFRSISIKLAEQIIPVCVTSDDNIHYLIIIYPPIKNLHMCLLEQHTRHMMRLITFLFGSIYRGLFYYQESIEYFFDIFFYRLHCLSSSSSSSINSSPILKNVRLLDEFLPAQFNDYGTCPKLNLNDQQLLYNINYLLNQLECQNFNQCSNENDFIINRYRRIFFLNGSVLFHRIHLLISHLSNETTIDIYRFLIHYGHLNMSQFYYDTWHLLLFKEIFLSDYESKQRSFLIVCSQGELTLAVLIQSEYEKNDFNIPPDHELIQQIKLTLNDIYSILPKTITNSLPWIVSSPVTFVKKQLKRTISLPLIGGFSQSNKSNTYESNIADTISLTSSHYPDQSQTDLRITQLVSQPESQDELYKSSRQSFMSSTLSLDEQQNKNLHSNLSTYRLHPGNYSTIFYYLDFQSIRGLLIAPYFTLDKLTQTTLIDRLLFETIQQTCIYIRRKHFSKQPKLNVKNLFSTKIRPKYYEIGCQFSLQTDPDNKKKKDANLFNFWIVAKKCVQPIEHEFFVCYHDSIAQNISELAFTIGMSSI
ncbi:unnamed protein product [Rotaria sordida]|uniref:CCZ1/INTU second Longin domain-containing protein n=1 Tax=Rotaria sordida TaxID=392033 RepID=A0A819SPX0_9BILA|nr:unnamed protein product [Rotaria sordida]